MPRIDPDKVKLLHGPYKTPKLRRGDRAQCLYRDKDVIVTGLSAGRIPWPLCKPPGRAHPGLLVEEELARAIRCESSLAVQHWWGACPRVVWCWRQALGVPRFNEGSLRLMRLVGQASADATRGKPLPPEQVEQRRRTAIALNLGRHLQPCPCPNGSRPWTKADDAIVRRLDPGAAAQRLGRIVTAVYNRRWQIVRAKAADRRGRWPGADAAGRQGGAVGGPGDSRRPGAGGSLALRGGGRAPKVGMTGREGPGLASPAG